MTTETIGDYQRRILAPETRDPRRVVFEKVEELAEARIPYSMRGMMALDIGGGTGVISQMLSSAGYRLSIIEQDAELAKKLSKRFPNAIVHQGNAVDKVAFPASVKFNLTTCINMAQYLTMDDLKVMLDRLRPHTRRLFITTTNSRSLYVKWLKARGMMAPFCHPHDPDEFDEALRYARFDITKRVGIGYLTPLTLKSDFRMTVLPEWLCKAVNSVADKRKPCNCHLYYVEAM